MTFSPTHNIVYIHVPKTAGTSIERLLRLGPTRHNPLRNYHMECPYVGTVRNPFDRLVSVWAYFRGGGNGQDQDVEAVTPSDFSEFVNRFIVEGQKFPRKWFLEPQSDMLIDGNRTVEHLVRFETLAADWSRVAKDLMLPDGLPHYRASDHGDYQDYYTPETMKIVGEFYNEDLCQFGYDF